MFRPRISWKVLAGAVMALNALCAEPPRIHIPYLSRAPRLEDLIAGQTANLGVPLSDFRQREPKDGLPASRRTTAYLSYDEQNFYALFSCEENPQKVRAHISKRESLGDDDAVGLALDTFHDGRHAYLFYANPLGVQADAMATEGQSDDFTFDAVWRSEGKLTSHGYAVLIAIPLRTLRFSPDVERTWGVALTRFIPTTAELASWPHLSSKQSAFVPQFATADGLQEAAPGRNIQLVPYLFLGADRFLNPTLPGSFQNSREIRGGVDAKVSLRNGLTLDLTVNPDFSQVESDEPQVTINQRYEVFFPERRPFFQENAGFFQTPETLFFSRRIINPQFGAKLTGKVGDWAVGALVADDRAGGAEQDPNASHALDAVGRVQRDLGRESSMGVLFTTRRTAESANSVISFDTRWKLTPNWILTGQMMRSDSTLGRTDQTGMASFTEIRHAGRHFNYYTNYRWRTPDFRSDLGYIPRVDIRQLKNVAGYRWWTEKGPLQSFGPAIFTLVNYDHTGQLRDWSVNAPFFFDFKGPISVSTDVGRSYEFYEGHGFQKSYRTLYAAVDRWKRVTFSGSYSTGVGINYYPAQGLQPFAGGSRDGQFEATFRPSLRLRIDESYLYSRLGSVRSVVYTNHQARTKVSYQFTRALSLRFIADYNSVLANTSLIQTDIPKRMVGDILFAYVVNPSTAIQIGYGNTHENLSLDDLNQRTRRPALQTSQHFFIKLNYLINR